MITIQTKGAAVIPSSTIHNADDYTKGWLRDYVRAVGRDVAPLSFHLLSGMCVLGSVVGRRAAIVRPGGVIWPPCSVLLLGPSGTGKSLALVERGLKVARAAMGTNEAFYLGSGAFTQAGLVSDLGQRQKRGVDPLEGLHIEDEASLILTNRTGNETIAQWIIKAVAYQPEFEEKTVHRGTIKLRNLMIAFGLGTTMEYLRKSVSVDEFTGGFMNRFLIAHESDQREVEVEETPSESEIADLAKELLSIRNALGDTLSLEAAVETRLRSLANQAKRRHFDSVHLTGFWNRYSMLLLKLSSLLAMAEARGRVTASDLDIAVSFLDTKLYPVLEGLVEELGASWDKKRLLELADSLRKAGPEGWNKSKFYRGLNTSNAKKQVDMLKAAVEMGLVWQVGSQVYGKAGWAKVDQED